MTEDIQVSGPGFAYPVIIANGALDDVRVWQQAGLQQGAMIVSNETVAGLYLRALENTLDKAGIAHSVCLLPDGEQYKTIASWQHIVEQLLAGKAHRKTTVVALGGGVIGDMAGFAAATYMRGIHVIQVPTTLLAQVDAAIGGKTGVNLPQGKNLLGAFHQPAMVIIDTGTLATLPEREYRAGLAEVIKYAMIMDVELGNWLEQNAGAIRAREARAVQHMITTCIAHKAALVAGDAHERGARALLNYGHSFAHALESLTGYTHWLHGEAVAIGMHLAAQFGCRQGLTDSRDMQRQKQLLDCFQFDFSMPKALTPERLASAMLQDKKADQGGISLILLQRIGAAVICPGIAEAQLQRFFRELA